jgi:hypothetical protein
VIELKVEIGRFTEGGGGTGNDPAWDARRVLRGAGAGAGGGGGATLRRAGEVPI